MLMTALSRSNLLRMLSNLWISSEISSPKEFIMGKIEESSGLAVEIQVVVHREIRPKFS